MTMTSIPSRPEGSYPSYCRRCADLIFEVVTRRYDASRTIASTNLHGVREWPEVIPSTAVCFVRCCEIINVAV